MKYGPFLRSFKLENFKAIQNSGTVKFTPLTVLIGNNGSGKSSLIEGLETYRSIVVDGLDAAMQRWYGMDHVWNKSVRHKLVGYLLGNENYENPIRFDIRGITVEGPYQANMKVNYNVGRNGILIENECIVTPQGSKRERDCNGNGTIKTGNATTKFQNKIDAGISAITPDLSRFVREWQFLNLMPDPMGRPCLKSMTSSGNVMLNRDGSNLAQYLLCIRGKDTTAFEGIVEAMRFVLDYAHNFEPVETREISPTMYLQMIEQGHKDSFEIPGWMLSTGTLRILALLAVLRNPDPPPLIVVEEVENGLDPRTISLVLDEVRTAVHSGKTQVILTTHSPYLLDLLPLQTLVLCERGEHAAPHFWRPSESEEVLAWAKDFAPGHLYTADRFKREMKS